MSPNFSIYNENYITILSLNFRNLHCSLPAVIKSKWNPHAPNTTADIMLPRTTTEDDVFKIKLFQSGENVLPQ